MEKQVFKLGMLEFGIFLLIAILTLVITFWFIKRFFAKSNQIEDYNLAYAILTSGIVFYVFLMVSAIVTPISATLKLLNSITNPWTYTFESSKHIAVLLLIALLSSLIVGFIAIKFSKRFYKGLTLLYEIKNNHIGISIFTVIVLISMSLLLRDSLQMVYDSFVPYPEMPNLLN